MIVFIWTKTLSKSFKKWVNRPGFSSIDYSRTLSPPPQQLNGGGSTDIEESKLHMGWCRLQLFMGVASGGRLEVLSAMGLRVNRFVGFDVLWLHFRREVFLWSTGADLGLGVGARLGNFWKSRVRVRQDTFTNKLLNIFSYKSKYIPI